MDRRSLCIAIGTLTVAGFDISLSALTASASSERRAPGCAAPTPARLGPEFKIDLPGMKTASANPAITLAEKPRTLDEMTCGNEATQRQGRRVAMIESEDCRVAASPASNVKSPTGASRDINTNFEASMKKRFMCGMLLGLASILPAPSYAANSPEPDVSPAPPKVLQSILNHFRPGEKAFGRMEKRATPGHEVLDVTVEPYYSTASAIGSVSMKVVVPPYPSVNGDQFISISYTVADSTNMTAALSATLVYCGSKVRCADGSRGSWLLVLTSEPEGKKGPTMVAQPGDTVSLDWNSQGSKWNLNAAVRRQGEPTHRLTLAWTLDTSLDMHLVDTPTFYAMSPSSANCDLLPARVSIYDIRIAAAGYDPRHWQTVNVPEQMDCSLNLTIPSQSADKIEITWTRDR